MKKEIIITQENKTDDIINFNYKDKIGEENSFCETPIVACLEVLVKFGYLKPEEIESLYRMSCKEHKEVIEENILYKIKEGLEFSNKIIKTFYK